MRNLTGLLLTLTELGMLAYWALAILALLELIIIPPDLMYSDHRNPMIVNWNWSFLPIDVLFAVAGLTGRFAPIEVSKRRTLSVVSLSLMFCAGLMAISFWTMQGSFDMFWWGVNLWLMALSATVLARRHWR